MERRREAYVVKSKPFTGQGQRESNLDDKIKAIFSLEKLVVLRILKRFDTPRKAMNIMHEEHAENLKANAIKMLKLQGVSLTAAAMETISEKYSNSLKYLCLMGALVHTPDGAIYLKALCKLELNNACQLSN
ncbi:unnamed protein product [Acanthocheilonema viteae]|uniref:Uncharacterized protein n=1 Tax=Acanthocheilonema viteae TaxID=6277 RepID=A0A498SVT7_ACAVI|nr:unnamed protein product [Acanthocheilonema viteae]